jgi:hypothetical protein
MLMRTATWTCGQLRLNCAGEPMKSSLCHCLECQRRTASAAARTVTSPRTDISAPTLRPPCSSIGDTERCIHALERAVEISPG